MNLDNYNEYLNSHSCCKCPHPPMPYDKDKKIENKVNITTSVNINQSAAANGGNGGNGGDGGEIEEERKPSMFPCCDDDEKKREEANGGSGGNGGNGGNASNTANVHVNNVVIIAANSHGPSVKYNLGNNERTLDINIDEDGSTYVNGNKMDEQELEDGTRVFLFRNSESKQAD